MIAELNLFGVFINAGLASAAAAAFGLVALRRLLRATGAYRWTWHPALVDVALFVLLWALVSLVEVSLGVHLLTLLG